VEREWPLRLGGLTAQIGPALTDEVVAAAEATQRRVRPLPARSGPFRARVVPVQRLGCGRAAGLPVGGAVADQRPAAAVECAAGAFESGVEPPSTAAGRRTATRTAGCGTQASEHDDFRRVFWFVMVNRISARSVKPLNPYQDRETVSG
jgi:hypothetical protein